MAKTYSSEAFIACDDPLDGVIFSPLVEIFKRQERLEKQVRLVYSPIIGSRRNLLF
jgi:hypothetical protein